MLNYNGNNEIKKMKNLSIIFLFLTFTSNVFSQEKLEFKIVDKKTYDFYTSQQWDSLIAIGNEALNNNIDYFYLRARMGAAYYEKQKFVHALNQFEKALAFNSNDNFVIESIYSCYVNLNRENEAEYIFKTNPLVFENKKNNSFFRGIFIEGGINNTGDNTSPFFTNHPPDIPWAESDVARQNRYLGGGLNFAVGKNALFTASYSNLNITNTRIILIGPDTLNDNYTTQQNQVYFNMSYRLKKGLKIIPSIHFIQVDYETVFSEFDPSQNKVILDRHNEILNDFASSLSIVKDYSFSSLSINGCYSQLNGTKPFQIGMNFTAYPFGNLNFYTISQVNFQKSGNVKHLIGEQTLGIKIMKHFWLDGFLTLGKLENYVEQNAYVVNNINDRITFRGGIGAIFPFGKLKISLKYTYLKKESFIKTVPPPMARRYIGPPPYPFEENYFTLSLSYKL